MGNQRATKLVSTKDLLACGRILANSKSSLKTTAVGYYLEQLQAGGVKDYMFRWEWRLEFGLAKSTRGSHTRCMTSGLSDDTQH